MDEIRVKDIVNQDRRNITNCESEPIHIPGSIQPHGFLIGVTADDFIIDYCSENCKDYLGVPGSALLGKKLSEFFDEKEVAGLHTHLSAQLNTDIAPYVFTVQDIKHNTSVYKTGNILVLELEPFPDGSLALPDLYLQTRKFVSILEETTSLQSLCQTIAEEIRSITGYDRVMIYRFDEEYNGEVYAETKRDDLEPFLGLHYPHTDIPAQARRLYLINLIRVIADVNYTPVPIFTVDNAADKTLDMSVSVLRSVSPIHVEYLQNMGVSGTLTISLIHNKKLWGMVTCHHYSPKLLPHYTRLSAQLQAHFLTSQINVREVAEAYEFTRKSEKYLQELQSILTSKNEFLAQLPAASAVLRLVNADGFAVMTDDKIYATGRVPDDKQIRKLAAWCAANNKRGQFITSSLHSSYPGAAEIVDTSAAIMYYSLGQLNANDCVIWFRHEAEKNINWAGKPTKDDTDTTINLTPRKSFQLWREHVKGAGEPWIAPEESAAAGFAYSLQKQFHLSFAKDEEIKSKLLNTRLKAVNEELENVNWISTHDLKEPLRKIQIFASKLMDLEKDNITPSGLNDISRMKRSAERMQRLIDDILSYSKLGKLENVFTAFDLNVLLDEIRDELKDNFAASHATMTADRLPVVNGIGFQLQQVFMNLIINALKFSKPEVPPHINITCSIINKDELNEFKKDAFHSQYYKIAFTDNGTGFDASHTEKIFNVFQRLHTSAEFKGTGIGLAICKKIMQNHHGFIEASGVEDKGATFTIYLPL